jgi:hypothetical protein
LAGHRTASVRIGLLWFCVAIVTEVVVGQLAFLLGVACAAWSILALSRRRPVFAFAGAVACSLASPLAGAFLLLGGVAWASTSRWRQAVPLLGALPGVALAAVAGGGGTFPLSVGTMIPIALLVVLGLALAPSSYRALRRGLLLYGGATVVLFVVPTPVGGNIARLGSLVAGPLAAAVLLRVDKRVWLALLAIPLAAWPACPAVAAIARSTDDPSGHADYYAELVAFLADHQRPYGRIEVPMTREHWEAAYVAPVYPLARGWQRQIDRRYNPIFYNSRKTPFTTENYHRWLLDNAVRYVAVPDAPLDSAGAAEAALLRDRDPPHWLRLVWHRNEWRVFEVVDPTPLTSGVGELTHLGLDEFTLHVRRPGTTLVRLHHSRMWRGAEPGVCIAGSAQGWTKVTVDHAGDVRVVARASLSALVGPLLRNDTARRTCTLR